MRRSIGFRRVCVRYLHFRIAIVVAPEEPFETHVDQRGMVDDELAGSDFVRGVGSATSLANAALSQQHGDKVYGWSNSVVLHGSSFAA
jgi:hypothetical protein